MQMEAVFLHKVNKRWQ